jgi:hypothetical protein
VRFEQDASGLIPLSVDARDAVSLGGYPRDNLTFVTDSLECVAVHAAVTPYDHLALL